MMKTSDRKPASRVALSTSLLFLGLFGAVSAGAADGAKPSEAGASCREEMRQVAVWKQGGNPKFNQSPQFEKRAVTVCDGKVVSQPAQRNAANQ